MMRALWAIPVTAGLCLTPSVVFASEPPTETIDTAIYVYKKLNPDLPAAWENSGKQTLLGTAIQGDWFTVIPFALPDWVCGPGYGIQQDKKVYTVEFVWPVHIEFPDDNIGWPPLIDARHDDLENYVDVPDCVVPEPTPEPTPVPTPESPAEPMLAVTGVNVAPVAIGGLVVALAGVVLKVAGRRKKATS